MLCRNRWFDRSTVVSFMPEAEGAGARASAGPGTERTTSDIWRLVQRQAVTATSHDFNQAVTH
jgi:hypothetical protein